MGNNEVMIWGEARPNAGEKQTYTFVHRGGRRVEGTLLWQVTHNDRVIKNNATGVFTFDPSLAGENIMLIVRQQQGSAISSVRLHIVAQTPETVKRAVANNTTLTPPRNNSTARVGQVDVNQPNYNTCQYTALEYIDDAGVKVKIFTEKSSEIANPNLSIGIITGRQGKGFRLQADDNSSTADCSIHNDIFTHNGNTTNATIINTSLRNIRGNVHYDYGRRFLSGLIRDYLFFPQTRINGLPTFIIRAATCRRSHTIRLIIAPDISWEFAFTFALDNALAHTHSGQQAGRIFAEAQTKARESGLDRYRLEQGSSIKHRLALSLKARFNKESNTVYTQQQFGTQWVQKIGRFTDALLRIKQMANRVKIAAGGTARQVTNRPFTFEIQSPKVGVIAKWGLRNSNSQLTTVGTLNLSANPLIGASFTINMLAVAGKVNPVVGAITRALNVAMDRLGGYLVLDVEFFGNLSITITALEFDSLSRRIAFSDTPLQIGGKMGVRVRFVARAEGTARPIGFDVGLKFNASASIHAYFGGEMRLGIDDDGVYNQIIGKFSGLIFSAHIDIRVGRSRRGVNGSIDRVTMFASEEIELGRHYLIRR